MILLGIEGTLTGPKFPGSTFLPFSKIRTTSAYFQLAGTSLDSQNLPKIIERGFTMTLTALWRLFDKSHQAPLIFRDQAGSRSYTISGSTGIWSISQSWSSSRGPWGPLVHHPFFAFIFNKNDWPRGSQCPENQLKPVPCQIRHSLGTWESKCEIAAKQQKRFSRRNIRTEICRFYA